MAFALYIYDDYVFIFANIVLLTAYKIILYSVGSKV